MPGAARGVRPASHTAQEGNVVDHAGQRVRAVECVAQRRCLHADARVCPDVIQPDCSSRWDQGPEGMRRQGRRTAIDIYSVDPAGKSTFSHSRPSEE